MKYSFFSIFLLLAVGIQACIGSTESDDPYVLSLDGREGPGQGKLIVLVSGDEEYRTEESMPMLAKILSEKHGFSCKVLFSWDESGTYIDPDNHQGVRGWHYLDNADLMIIGTRFRNPSRRIPETSTDNHEVSIIEIMPTSNTLMIIGVNVSATFVP